MQSDITVSLLSIHDLIEAFPLIHPRRRLAEAAFAVGPFRRIGQQNLGPRGECYRNSIMAAGRNGGQVCYGWEVLLWPNVTIMATHHAVWQRADGTLIDVTTKPTNDRRVGSTFVRDDSTRFPIGAPQPGYTTKFLALTPAPELNLWIELQNEYLRLRASLVRRRIDAGGVWNMREGRVLANEGVDRAFAADFAKEKYLLTAISQALDALIHATRGGRAERAPHRLAASG